MSHPNILLIVIDDLGWADLACFGSSFYETPHLDALANRGLRFTDAYASCPVCSPTRASLMTGKYPARVGITNWIPGNPWGKLMGVPFFHSLPREERTLAHYLGEAGYRTYHVGKWHLGDDDHRPEHFGFDVNIAGCHMGCPYHGFFSPYEIPTLAEGPEGEYLTDRLTDEADALIAKHGPGGEHQGTPMFMNLCHYAVHTPLQAPADLVAKYEAKARAMGIDPDAVIEEGEAFACLHKKDERVQRRVVQSHATYAAMIENLDTNLGKTFAALERHGLADNTLVIFTSDNGGLSSAEGSPTCNAPLSEGKGWMEDGGNRVSQIVSWPGVVQSGQTSGCVTTSPDLFSTLLEAAGVKPADPGVIDGVSLMPLLKGDASFDRGAVFWHYPHYSNQGGVPSCAIREGDWKLTEYFEDGRLTLYNLQDDIGEQRDLADANPQIVSDLDAKLVSWRESLEARIPEPNPDYDAMLAGTMPSPNMFGKLPGSDH